MPLRISDLPVAATPLAAGSLVEVSVPTGTQPAYQSENVLASALVPVVFASAQIPLVNTTAVYSAAHGLGYVPCFVRGVLVCLATDANIGGAAGQELDVMSLVFGSSTPYGSPFIYADAAEVYVAFPTNLSSLKAIPLAGGVFQNFSSLVNNFALKFYAL
jgi:hypothetical protein